jgi:hypothetical protein
VRLLGERAQSLEHRCEEQIKLDQLKTDQREAHMLALTNQQGGDSLAWTLQIQRIKSEKMDVQKEVIELNRDLALRQSSIENMMVEGKSLSSQLQLAQQSHPMAWQLELQSCVAELQIALRCQQLEKERDAVPQQEACWSASAMRIQDELMREQQVLQQEITVLPREVLFEVS